MKKKDNTIFLLKMITEIANTYHDGHFTIYRFTTHYKVAFGTITNPRLEKMIVGKTLEESLRNLILNSINNKK